VLETIASGEGWRKEEKSLTAAEVACDGESAVLSFE